MHLDLLMVKDGVASGRSSTDSSCVGDVVVVIGSNNGIVVTIGYWACKFSYCCALRQ